MPIVQGEYWVGRLSHQVRVECEVVPRFRRSRLFDLSPAGVVVIQRDVLGEHEWMSEVDFTSVRENLALAFRESFPTIPAHEWRGFAADLEFDHTTRDWSLDVSPEELLLSLRFGIYANRRRGTAPHGETGIYIWVGGPRIRLDPADGAVIEIRHTMIDGA